MSSESRGALQTLDQAATDLALADNLDDIKTIRNRAEAVRTYAKSAALGLEAQNRAAEVKLRAERKAGELLMALRPRGGDRKLNAHAARLSLADLGITHDQSTRWQLQARLDQRQFDEPHPTVAGPCSRAGRDRRPHAGGDETFCRRARRAALLRSPRAGRSTRRRGARTAATILHLLGLDHERLTY